MEFIGFSLSDGVLVLVSHCSKTIMREIKVGEAGKSMLFTSRELPSFAPPEQQKKS